MVEDDSALAESLKAQLSYFGYEVSTFATLASLRVAMESRPDVVVLVNLTGAPVAFTVPSGCSSLVVKVWGAGGGGAGGDFDDAGKEGGAAGLARATLEPGQFRAPRRL